MKWLEIIELRSVGSNQDILKSKIEKLIEDVEKEESGQSIQTFSHITISTDFSIHLFHDSQNVPASGSPLGFQIVSSLKEYGLVNHSIWFEMNSNAKKK